MNVSYNVDELVALALAEDFGTGDVTSLYFVDGSLNACALMRSRSAGVVSGVDVAEAVFKAVDADLVITVEKPNGSPVAAGDVVMRIEGAARSILGGERTALNFIQRLSGVASMTAHYMQRIAHTKCQLLDTRKTTPGYRLLEKAAVRHGGGSNHRLGLYDRAMVKDNHLMTASSLLQMQDGIDRLKADKPNVEVELEADTLEQVAEFLTLRGVDYILLDNMSNDEMREAVRMRGENVKPYFEASGGLSYETAAAAAETGVDFMSFGCLTHSVPSLDLGLDFIVQPS